MHTLAHTHSPRTHNHFSALTRIDLVPHTYFHSSSNTGTRQIQARHPPERSRSAHYFPSTYIHRTHYTLNLTAPVGPTSLKQGGKEKACGRNCLSLANITVFVACILFITPLTVQTQIAPLLSAKWPVAQEVDKRLTLFIPWERMFFS